MLNRFFMLQFIICLSCVSAVAENKIKKFEIAGNTVPCHGAVPMRCLVVNGNYFYQQIEGYQHKEGRAVTLYVEQRLRPKPIPADAGIYTYHLVRKFK